MFEEDHEKMMLMYGGHIRGGKSFATRAWIAEEERLRLSKETKGWISEEETYSRLSKEEWFDYTVYYGNSQGLMSYMLGFILSRYLKFSKSLNRVMIEFCVFKQDYTHSSISRESITKFVNATKSTIINVELKRDHLLTDFFTINLNIDGLLKMGISISPITSRSFPDRNINSLFENKEEFFEYNSIDTGINLNKVSIKAVAKKQISKGELITSDAISASIFGLASAHKIKAQQFILKNRDDSNRSEKFKPGDKVSVLIDLIYKRKNESNNLKGFEGIVFKKAQGKGFSVNFNGKYFDIHEKNLSLICRAPVPVDPQFIVDCDDINGILLPDQQNPVNIIQEFKNNGKGTNDRI